MSGPLAAEKSVELYNRLLRLTPDDRVAVEQILWQLRSLVTRQPANYRAIVVIIHAEMLLGNVSSALAYCDEIWGRRATLDAEAAETFAMQLVGLGLYEKFLSFAGDWFLLAKPSDRLTVRLRALWGIGEINEFSLTLKELSIVCGKTYDGWSEFLIKLAASPLARHFKDHQRIVTQCLFGWQTFTNLMLLDDPDDSDDWDTPVAFCYGPGSYSARRALSDGIDDRLSEFYSNLGIEEAFLAYRLTPTLLPLDAVPGRTEILEEAA